MKNIHVKLSKFKIDGKFFVFDEDKYIGMFSLDTRLIAKTGDNERRKILKDNTRQVVLREYGNIDYKTILPF